MKTMPLLAGLLAANMFVLSSPSTLCAKPVAFSVATVAATSGADAKIPIQAKDAKDVGAIQFDLVYDPAVLSPVNVETGAQGSGLVAYNVIDRGRLRIAMASNQAISNDGEFLVITVKVIGSTGTPLTLENGRAWGYGDAQDMPVVLSPGRLDVRSPYTTWLIGAIVGCGVLLVLLFATSRRKARP